MANREQVALLKEGVRAWNDWRQANHETLPALKYATLPEIDLGGANLEGANLTGANLAGANLSGANLSWSYFKGANLSGVDLRRADFGRADLREARLTGAKLGDANAERANLSEANLERADLREARLERTNCTQAILRETDLREARLERTNFTEADLGGADLTDAWLDGTVIGNVDLSDTRGLERCQHLGPSFIDHFTLQLSGNLPNVFLRGCGLPDRLIDYLPSLLDDPIQFYSCFISYSSKDEDFARRLHADLQDNGVRCWFAPEDLKIGDRLAPTIDTAIRVRDKLLLILSETSVASAWVTKEVRTAIEEEERHDKAVLFPLRLDDAVLDTTDQWAHDIRRNRHIGDFTNWKSHDDYQKGLKRLLRDLKVERTGNAS